MDRHSLTTDAVVSVLVLLITVLNVDHIARRRQLRERERVTAAQAMIDAGRPLLSTLNLAQLRAVEGGDDTGDLARGA